MLLCLFDVLIWAAPFLSGFSECAMYLTSSGNVLVLLETISWALLFALIVSFGYIQTHHVSLMMIVCVMSGVGIHTLYVNNQGDYTTRVIAKKSHLAANPIKSQRSHYFRSGEFEHKVIIGMYFLGLLLSLKGSCAGCTYLLARWTALYALCPLAISEVAINKNVETIVLPLLMLLINMAYSYSDRLPEWRELSMGVTLGTIGSITPFSVCLAPLIMIWIHRRNGYLSSTIFILSYIVTLATFCVFCVLPYNISAVFDLSVMITVIGIFTISYSIIKKNAPFYYVPIIACVGFSLWINSFPEHRGAVLLFILPLASTLGIFRRGTMPRG